MRNAKYGLVALVMAAAVGLAACGDSSTGVGTTRLSLRLTDAPGDLLEAWVGVDSVWLQGNVGGQAGDHVTLMDTPSGLVNLSSLDSTTTELVAGVDVPSGTYAQLRIFVSQGVAVAENASGDTIEYTLGGAELPSSSEYAGSVSGQGSLTCPSCAQSGFKVNLPGGSVKLSGSQQILLVDFDVAQSFGHDAAVSNQWVLHPVMTSTQFETSGTIQGTVSLGSGLSALPDCPSGTSRTLAAFVPTATLSTDASAVSSGTVQGDGTYAIDFLSPATYQMGYEGTIDFDGGFQLQFDATPTKSQVDLGSGQSATVDYTVNSATCLTP